MPYPSYGGGHYSHAAPQWHPHPEPHGHPHPSHTHPTYDYDRGAHTPHPRRGPAELPQQHFYPQNLPNKIPGPLRRPPSEPREDRQTLPNFHVHPTHSFPANGHGAYTPHPGRLADLLQQHQQHYPQQETSSRISQTPGPVRRYPSEPAESFPNPTVGRPLRRPPSEPREDPQTLPNFHVDPIQAFPAYGHGAYTPHPGRPADLPQQHQQHFPPKETSSRNPQPPGPVRRYPSEPTESFPNPTVGPAAPYQRAPTPPLYELMSTLVPRVSQYPSIDWNITLPIETARLWMSPKHKTRVDFSPFAIIPPVRTVTIVASKAASPLGLVFNIWGPINIKAKEPLTIGSLLNEIKKYFDTPIREVDKEYMDAHMQKNMLESNSKRCKTQEGERALYGKSVQIHVCRADTLFQNFQYGGLRLHDDFPINRKIELTLENGSIKYRN
ncbi:hypothetical protein M413DRAFT_344306 [Hebeloma cylindrosporum]|uniref:DUF6699 domain-containing protein n=1 Tax=Hebeloma cylindrosporum TaxID=76867 RepID=A0A0C2YXD1_HEBCY|nr:hypothetical protein M413DRAFT_344306 [Hebeloma cylindrosporum h7]